MTKLNWSGEETLRSTGKPNFDLLKLLAGIHRLRTAFEDLDLRSINSVRGNPPEDGTVDASGFPPTPQLQKL